MTTTMSERESIVWSMMVTIGVTTIGYFCKKLDSENSVKQMRCSNSFAAGYSFLLLLMSLDWLFFDLSQGSFSGLHTVLSTDPKQVVDMKYYLPSGRRICVFMFAYMFQDVFVRLLFNEADFRYILHHFACLLGIIMVLVFDQSPLHCISLCISEFSTPVVCLLEIAQTEGQNVQKYLEPCGILLNLLFPLRIVWFSYCFYAWFFLYRTETLFAISKDNIGYCCVFLLLLINWSWWVQLVYGTIKILYEQQKQNGKLKTT